MENLYRDSPTSAPFATSTGGYDLDQLREDDKEYRNSLVERISNLNTEIGYTLRSDLMYLTEEFLLWDLEKVEQLPINELRNITVLVENTEEILKDNPKLLH